LRIIKKIIEIDGVSFDNIILAKFVKKEMKAKKIAKLRDIETLDLASCKLESIDNIEYVINLKELTLINNNLKDISKLVYLTKLKTLYLVNIKVKNIEEIGKITSLVELNIQENDISNIDFVKDLRNLEGITCYKNNIKDIGSISGLKYLKVAEFLFNNIESIEPLKDNKCLEEIYLSNNSISDITALSELTGLTEIWINNNKITDITSLKKLKNLKYLNVLDNNIADITQIQALKEMGVEVETDFDINKNTISYRFGEILRKDKEFATKHPFLDFVLGMSVVGFMFLLPVACIGFGNLFRTPSTLSNVMFGISGIGAWGLFLQGASHISSNPLGKKFTYISVIVFVAFMIIGIFYK